MTINWQNALAIAPAQYDCGYCGNRVGPALGYNGHEVNLLGQPIGIIHNIYVCSFCNKPTYLDAGRTATPGPTFGQSLASLPSDVGDLYDEARRAISAGAPTCATMGLRTLLAHIAVNKGAADNINFLGYVTWLVDNHYVPPNSQGWVDHIRRTGNAAVHDLRIITSDEAKELLDFTEMILRFVYDYPARVPQVTPPGP